MNRESCNKSKEIHGTLENAVYRLLEMDKSLYNKIKGVNVVYILRKVLLEISKR